MRDQWRHQNHFCHPSAGVDFFCWVDSPVMRKDRGSAGASAEALSKPALTSRPIRHPDVSSRRRAGHLEFYNTVRSRVAGDEISHRDIYLKLGTLEGKLDAVMISVAEKKSDLDEAFRRIRLLESRVAQGVILIACLSVVAPLVWTSLDPELRVQSVEQPAVPHAPSRSH